MPNRRALKRPFGLSAGTVRHLERLGYLRASGRTPQYDFRELLVLRTIATLRAAKLPIRTIHRALHHLQPWLSDERPLSRVVLEPVRDSVIVREGTSLWEPGSGQYALPLEVRQIKSHVLPMKKRTPPTKPVDFAHDHYLRGADLEEADAEAAKAAYEACLQGDCSHMNARINLGRLLHLEGKHTEAESIYRGTQEPDAVLYFNLGIVLEDQGKPKAAMAAYRDAIVHDPGIADAHFNLALLLERAGETQAAFRHLLAYRRLIQVN